MRRLAALPLLFILGISVHAAEAKTTLGVVLVVDQMRADYTERFAQHGMGRFLREGAYYDQAKHGHIPTYTAVGHSALSTGRFPKDHGIVGNEFYDREEGKTVYCVEHDKHGTGPFRLTAPTLGDALKEASPDSKIVSISAKDRAAVLMAGKKADLVLWYDKKTGRFTTSSFYGSLPRWVKAWNAENEVEEPRRKSIREHPHIDQLTLSLARRAMEAMDLGEDDVPDLLWVSLSATDYLGHAVGPYDPRMDDQLKRLDREVGSFLDYLDFKVGKNSYVAALSSDHGVLPLPESSEGKAIGARRLSSKDVRRDLESSLRAEFGKPADEKDWILGWSAPQVVLNLEGLKKSRRKKIVRRAAALLAAHEAFVWAHPTDAIAAAAPHAEEYLRSLAPGRTGDIVYLLKYGVLITDYPTGTSHGTPYDYDARVPLGLLGAGVKAGRYQREALTVELAPTMGRLLGIAFEGDRLQEALSR